MSSAHCFGLSTNEVSKRRVRSSCILDLLCSMANEGDVSISQFALQEGLYEINIGFTVFKGQRRQCLPRTITDKLYTLSVNKGVQIACDRMVQSPASTRHYL